MNDVTRILSDLAQGVTHATEQLLPLVYDELRQLAAQKWKPREVSRALRGRIRDRNPAGFPH
jgi:hypothetical protein